MKSAVSFRQFASLACPQVIAVPAAARLALKANRSVNPIVVSDAAVNAHQRSPTAPSSIVQAGPACSRKASLPSYRRTPGLGAPRSGGGPSVPVVPATPLTPLPPVAPMPPLAPLPVEPLLPAAPVTGASDVEPPPSCVPLLPAPP